MNHPLSKATSRFLVAATSIILAPSCASNGSEPPTDLDGNSNQEPIIDSGSDASSTDADAAPSDPCIPGALCPVVGGPFDLEPNGIEAGNPGSTLDLRTRITAIHGRSADDVWASGARGTMVHYDGATWKVLSVDTKETINEFWLQDSAEVAFVSFQSVYARGLEVPDLDAGIQGWIDLGAPPAPADLSSSLGFITSTWMMPGTEWLWLTTVERQWTPQLSGIWRARLDAASGVEFGSIFSQSGYTTYPCGQMEGIHGVSADDLWAVGGTGDILHITEAQSDSPILTQFESFTWAGLNDVWAAAANDVWAVGRLGTIRHYAGQSESFDIVANVPTTEDLRAIWGTSASDIWAVGTNSVVLHYDGSAWTSVAVGGLSERRPTLYSVWSGEPGHVWVGGDGALLSMGGQP